MSQTLQPTLLPALTAEPRGPAPPSQAVLALIMTPPSAVASQLVWAGHPLPATLLSALLAILTLAWYWRARPGA